MKLTKHVLFFILLASLPLLRVLLDGSEVNAYDYTFQRFDDYLDTKSGTPVENYHINEDGDQSTFTFNTEDISRIRITPYMGSPIEYTITYDSYGGDSAYTWTSNEYGLHVEHAYYGDYIDYYDGSITESYFFMESYALEIWWLNDDLSSDDKDFYGIAFFGDPEYSYDPSDDSLVRYWLEYESDNDSGGLSASELGHLIVVDGLLGMIPRMTDGEVYVPVIHSLAQLGISGLGLLSGTVSGAIRAITGAEAIEPDIVYTDTYHLNGTGWTYSGGTYYYEIEPAGFWGGERLRYNATLGYYMSDYARFWVWVEGLTFVSDEVMIYWEIETNTWE